MSSPEPTLQQIKKVEEIQSKLIECDRIKAIVASAELAFDLVKSSGQAVVGSDVFEDAAVRLAGHVYEAEKKRVGMGEGLKVKKADMKKQPVGEGKHIPNPKKGVASGN